MPWMSAGRWLGRFTRCTPIFREALEADIERAEHEEQPNTGEIAKLRETLASMPQEPEEGAENWLLNVDNGYFENNVVSAIRDRFSETPYWGSDGARTRKTTCHGRLPLRALP
jgi:hypothetical protein